MNSVLRDRDYPGSVSVGLAQMRPGEKLDELINRADDALVEVRGRPEVTAGTSG